MHLSALLLPLLLTQPAAVSYGSRAFSSFEGENVSQAFNDFVTFGTVDDAQTLEQSGSRYEFFNEGGHNFAKLRTLVRASRSNGSPTTFFQSETFKVTEDNLRIRAQDHPGAPLKAFLKVEVTGVPAVFIANPLGGTIFSSASYQVGFRKATDAVEISKGGQWQATNAGTNFAGTLPGLLSVGPLLCTENVAFDVVMKNRVASSVSSTNVASPILGYSSADFSQTIRVMGIELQDENGTPITNFKVISHLGVDWTKKSNPAKLTGFSVSKTTLVGGQSLNGTVKLDHRAEQGGQSVFMTCPSGKASPPPEVIVPYLADSSTFAIPTSPVGTTRQISIFARMGAVSRSRTITLNPAL